MSDLLRVLLVEDNPGDADLIVEHLPKDEFTLFEVECVARLSEALERVGPDRFDIILLDLGLPDSDGLATHRAMRRQAPQLPIVVLTGNIDEQVALASIHEGVQDYLIKGQIDKINLARSIKYAIERKRWEDKLHASETKLRQLYESMMDAYCRVDMLGRVVEFNTAFVNLLGYTDEELYHLAYVDITPARWHSVEDRIVNEQVISRGYSDLYEKEYRRKDGTLVPIELRTVLLKDETGRPSGMWAIVRDISERKQAEAELQFRNILLSTQQEASLDGILVVDGKDRILSYNRNFVEMWGIPAKLLEKGVDEPILPLVASQLADPKAFLQRVKFLYEHKQEISRDELILKDGRVFDRYSAPMFGTDEQYFGRVWYLRDITEHKRAETALKESEEKYRRVSQEYHTLLDNLPDAIVQIAPDHGVVWANRSMTEMAKDNEAQLNGNCCFQAFWSKGEFCSSCPVARSFHSGEFEGRDIKTPDSRLLELRAVPICDESGKVENVILVIRDLTEHRKLESQLRQAQKMESIGTLAGGIAHDFNNILTAIVGYGYMAQMNMGPDDPQRENIEHMLEGADRAAHLTKDLLIFSRKQVSEKAPVDLNDIVSIVEKFLMRIIGEDVICKLTLHGEPIVVLADMHQLEQVLMNLATNARDAMPGGGNLMIDTGLISLGHNFIASHGYGKPGKYALLTVADTGKGMDEDTRKKIFEPFFTTKEVGKGTGLGLAVVYGIIKEHEGYINAYSKPGIGTTFKIYLPLISSDVRKVKKAQERETSTQGTETILLAEDDEFARDLIGNILKQQGYTVIEAVDGKDAVMKFMENKETIDLLLSDLIMPKLNGKEAFEEMKVWRPELKAIFVSGYAPAEIREKMRLEYGMLLLAKPILPKALLQKVRSFLDEGEE